jgi:hypothetical protein
LSVYKEYKDTADYSAWKASTVAALRAHGLALLVAHPPYQPDPNDPFAVEDWWSKQAFGYMMLDQRVLTTTGRRIVQSYRWTGDAQSVFRDLELEAHSSTQAALSASDLLSKMTTLRYDGRSSKTAITFITEFEAMIDRYNEQQSDNHMILTTLFRKTLLQNAVADISMLLDVSNQDKQAMARGAPSLDWHEYLHLIKSAASMYDRRKLGRHSRGSVNQVDVVSDRTDDDIATEITEYFVNEMRRRMPGSSMNKATWESLSKEGRSVWDTLSDGDKKKILQYAVDRAEKPVIQANQHETSTPDGTETPAPDESTASTPTTVEINNLVTNARKEAHPGDARRMMGAKTKPQKNRKADVRFASFQESDGDGYQSDDDDMVDGYWDPQLDDDAEDFHRGD